ncbi:hypothetical protein PC117_g23528 [Phytophthora cactorum]|uniref:Vacuolar protein-sorting-associated protein 25 n=2 Tax=Phytophthora cactorum TaxID=29920 RepID=A0A8T1B5K2_9STRA|nr:hypothetical protein PC117_g23528 [Phytophthora cactorum]
MDKFSYPEYYDFPPFFTLQPVRATREKQLVLWQQLILEYHRAHDLPLFQPLASTLFENVKISRNMAQDGRMAVVEHLIRCGHGRWEDDTKTRCRIMWKKPAEWAIEIYDFAKEHGMLGNVFTVYELYAGEETLGTNIHGMEPWLLREALGVLEGEQKAAVIAGETCEEDGLVTLRYTLGIGACWFADSRRRRYAKGFYSCSRVPQTPPVAPVALESLESLPAQLKKLAPSEIESEDDDSEVGGVPSVNKTPATSPSGHSKSLLDVRTRSNTTDGEIQRRQATRPRSTSAAGESRSRRSSTRGKVSRNINADVKESNRRVPRRRADTGMTSSTKHNERSPPRPDPAPTGLQPKLETLMAKATSCKSSAENCSCEDCKCCSCCSKREACRGCGCPPDKCSRQGCNCAACASKKKPISPTKHASTQHTSSPTEHLSKHGTSSSSEHPSKHESSTSSSGVKHSECASCGSPGGQCKCVCCTNGRQQWWV